MGYWALYGWSELYRAGTQVYTEADSDIWCTATKAENGDILVYLSYFNDDAGLNACPPENARAVIDLPGVKSIKLNVVDDARDYDEVPVCGNSFEMKGNSFVLAHIEV